MPSLAPRLQQWGHTHRIGLLIALLALTPTLAFGQSKLDEVLSRAVDLRRTPGIAAAIIKDSQPVYMKAMGFADLENEVSASTKTVFQIGSLTKSLAATATMILVEQGAIKLDDSITKHLPELPSAWSSVKIRNLLQHTSGIEDYSTQPEFDLVALTEYSHEKVLALIKDKPLRFKPGERFQYCNTGYYLLGKLIEVITKQPLRTAYRRLIFAPLQMDSTDLFSHSEVVKNRARGYMHDDKRPLNATQFRLEWSLSALSTLEDLVKWTNAQGSSKLLSAKGWQMMWDAAVLNNGEMVPYGFGWRLTMRNSIPTIEHGGKIAGFSMQLVRYPTKGVAVIVLTNAFDCDAKAIAADLVRAYDPTLEPAKESFEPITDPTPDLSQKLESTMSKVLAGTADPALFAETLRKEIFPDNIKEVAAQLGQLGKLSEFTLVKAADEDGYKVRSYTFLIGKQKFLGQFSVDSSGLIAGLTLRRLQDDSAP